MSTEEELQWWSVPNRPGEREWPKWARSVAFGEDGRAFIPASVAGDERQVLLCAGWDGASVLVDGGHLYAEAGWLAREFPKTAALCALIERRAKELMARGAEVGDVVLPDDGAPRGPSPKT